MPMNIVNATYQRKKLFNRLRMLNHKNQEVEILAYLVGNKSHSLKKVLVDQPTEKRTQTCCDLLSNLLILSPLHKSV